MKKPTEITLKDDKLKSIGDVAIHAEAEGFCSYNMALSHFESDRIIPAYECHFMELYKGIGGEYEWSEISTKIFDSFMKKYGYLTITLD